MEIIAKIHNGFTAKFAVPRQSGLAKIESKIIFEPPFRDADAVRGMEGFSHLWLIWGFSEIKKYEWKPTVRPPKLGGNKRMGVFATRSPFRPNNIGLSCVKIKNIEIDHKLGPIITVVGADLINGTPIYDIKPYIPYSDSIPEAKGGFADEHYGKFLNVVFLEKTLNVLPKEVLPELKAILEQDPRPAYHGNPERIYSFEYYNYRIKFNVKGNNLTVTEVIAI